MSKKFKIFPLDLISIYILVFLISFLFGMVAIGKEIFPKIQFLDSEVHVEHRPGKNPFALIHVDNLCSGGMWQKTVDTEYGSVDIRWQSFYGCANGPNKSVRPDILSVVRVPELVTSIPDRVETWEDGNTDTIELWYFQGM